MWDTANLDLRFLKSQELRGRAQWYPTSREKRARYGAPKLLGQEGFYDKRKGRDCSRPFSLVYLLGCHFFGFAFLPHQLQLTLGFLEGRGHFLLHAGSGFFEFLR
jgi:hypothetical protein